MYQSYQMVHKKKIVFEIFEGHCLELMYAVLSIDRCLKAIPEEQDHGLFFFQQLQLYGRRLQHFRW